MFSLDVVVLLLSCRLLTGVLLLVVLLLSCRLLTGVLLSLRSLWVALLLARPHTAPLGQLGLWPLVPLGQFVFPHGLQPLCSHNLGPAFVELLPVSVCPCVSPALVL